MLDLSQLNTRYFDVKVGETVFELEPPKMKMLRDLLRLAKELTSLGDNTEIEERLMDDLAEAIAKILSKNKKKKVVDTEYVYDNLELDAMLLLVNEYFEWVAEIKSDPN